MLEIGVLASEVGKTATVLGVSITEIAETATEIGVASVEIAVLYIKTVNTR